MMSIKHQSENKERHIIEARDDQGDDGINSSQGGSDFGSVDIPEKKEAGCKIHHHPRHSPGRSIIASVKKYATKSPSSSVASSMHYATPRSSYLQQTLHVAKGTGAQKTPDSEIVEHDLAKGGLRGTFSDHRSNYLQQQVKRN